MELGRVWHDKRRQEKASSDEAIEIVLTREAMRARKEVALAKAEAILAAVDNKVEDNPPGSFGQRRSAFMLLGEAAGIAEGMEAYAVVYVTKDTERQEVTATGRFFKKSTA